MCIHGAGSGKHVFLLTMTAGCQRLEPWGPADLLSWKTWRHCEGGTSRPGCLMGWGKGRRGQRQPEVPIWRRKKMLMLLREARKSRGSGTAPTYTCPPVLKHTQNVSSLFLHNQSWDLTFWKVLERTPGLPACWVESQCLWMIRSLGQMLSSPPPRPQLPFLWEACRYRVLELAALPGVLIISWKLNWL